MSFKINIKSKSFTNKHDKVKVEVLKNVNLEIKLAVAGRTKTISAHLERVM